MTDNYLIRVKDVSFSYQRKQIYKDLTLDIPKGKITAILGPSGTGKTTILRLIGAQLTPDEGMILTKDDKNFCYRTIVPESEVKLWHEVEDRGQKNNI